MKTALKQQIDFALATALDALTPPRNSEEAAAITACANARAALAESNWTPEFKPTKRPAIVEWAFSEDSKPEKPLPWHVAAISSNRGSFGHAGVVVLRESGEAMELTLQAYGSEGLPKVGDVLEVLPTSEVQPRTLPHCKDAKKIISSL